MDKKYIDTISREGIILSKSRFIQEIYELFLNKKPSINIIKKYCNNYKNDPDEYNLQDFCVEHRKLPYLTGIGIIEAVNSLFAESVGNANLRLLEDFINEK